MRLWHYVSLGILLFTASSAYAEQPAAPDDFLNQMMNLPALAPEDITPPTENLQPDTTQQNTPSTPAQPPVPVPLPPAPMSVPTPPPPPATSAVPPSIPAMPDMPALPVVPAPVPSAPSIPDAAPTEPVHTQSLPIPTPIPPALTPDIPNAMPVVPDNPDLPTLPTPPSEPNGMSPPSSGQTVPLPTPVMPPAPDTSTVPATPEPLSIPVPPLDIPVPPVAPEPVTPPPAPPVTIPTPPAPDMPPVVTPPPSPAPVSVPPTLSEKAAELPVQTPPPAPGDVSIEETLKAGEKVAMPSELPDDGETIKETKPFSWTGSVMFDINNSRLLREALEALDTGYFVSNPNDASGAPILSEQAADAPPKPPVRYTSPSYFLNTLLYLSSENWAVWLNGKKYTHTLPDGDITILSVFENRVTISWKGPAPLDILSPKWKTTLTARTENGNYASDDGRITVNPKENSVTFTLKPNQSFSLYAMRIVEGRVRETSFTR